MRFVVDLQCLYLAEFLTNLQTFAAICVKKGQGAGFLHPISSDCTLIVLDFNCHSLKEKTA